MAGEEYVYVPDPKEEESKSKTTWEAVLGQLVDYLTTETDTDKWTKPEDVCWLGDRGRSGWVVVLPLRQHCFVLATEWSSFTARFAQITAWYRKLYAQATAATTKAKATGAESD